MHYYIACLHVRIHLVNYAIEIKIGEESRFNNYYEFNVSLELF